METPIVVPEMSALNLDIPGTTGNFFVSDSSGSVNSIEVKYILTHLGLDTSGGHGETLLSNLKPVREVFSLKDLKFDEIMQRDIDDQRVSLDLISYLFEEGQKGLVKLFPPIIVVVVPIQEGSASPAYYYPQVETFEKIKEDNFEYKIVRSGNVGSEAFELRQMWLGGVLSDHNYSKLRLNTNKVKLAIVDGQHRAMALLSLYRNIKGWPDGTAGYKSYYRRWTKDVIERKDLSNLKLPIMVCVFPELDSSTPGLVKVTEACRSIFLDLNKTAKPVTRARNILLNDRDMIAEFLRDTLSIVKSSDENASLLNLFNIQLDADSDNTRLTSEMAMTAVMHLYSLIERLMLNSKGISGFSTGGNNLWLVKSLDSAFQKYRLNAKDLIGSELCKDTKRRNYLDDTKVKIVEEFHQRYSRVIINCLEKFYPYRIHAQATRKVRAEVTSKSDAQAESILFGNQGVENIFNKFREKVTIEIKDLKDYGSKEIPPGLKDSKTEFDNTFERITLYKENFIVKRAQLLFAKKTLCKPLIAATQDLYDKNFTTSAFQNGLLLTFFNMIEEYQESILGKRIGADKVFELSEEYISSINSFFAIEDDNNIRNVCRVFLGKYKGKFNTDEMQFQENDAYLRNILISKELNPKEWPKFRFLFLELWHSELSDLDQLIENEVENCRVLLYKMYCKQSITAYCKVNNIEEDEIKIPQKESIYTKCRKILIDEINALNTSRRIEDDSIFDIWK